MLDTGTAPIAQRFMNIYSKQESEIFGLPFGRINLPENFDSWDDLTNQISESQCKFIRVKVPNPNALALDKLNSLAHKVHLLEILRVYRSQDLLHTPFENEHSNLKFELVNDDNVQTLEKLVCDTYDDIPFGNYTPPRILEIFPPQVQLKGLVAYFKENYTGSDYDKLAYIAYTQNGQPVGCSISDYFDLGTYSYYVGVDRNERHKGIQYKIVNHIKFYTTARNKPFLCGATRLMNLYSARTMEKTGCKCTGYDWVYLLEL